MSSSITFSETQTFTINHANHIASKVATDLKRLQRFYGEPSDSLIEKYVSEIIELLRYGYLENITYGYKRNGNWIEPTLKYHAKDFTGISANDDDPGRIQPNANISNAIFSSYLIYSSTWERLPLAEQKKFESKLPFQRTGSNEPGISGYMNLDKTYSSGGKGLERSTLKSY